MIRSFVLNVLPQIPAKLGQSAYAVATVHAVVGVIGVVLGVFVVLRGNELVPQAAALHATTSPSCAPPTRSTCSAR